MPEMLFNVRWPDGSVERCYSPSLIVEEHMVPGESYPLKDFVARARTSLEIASERVRERYGFACSSALDQLARIEATAERFAAAPDARVAILSFER